MEVTVKVAVTATNMDLKIEVSLLVDSSELWHSLLNDIQCGCTKSSWGERRSGGAVRIQQMKERDGNG